MKHTLVGNMTVAINCRLHMTFMKSRVGDVHDSRCLKKGKETCFLVASSNPLCYSRLSKNQRQGRIIPAELLLGENACVRGNSKLGRLEKQSDPPGSLMWTERKGGSVLHCCAA